MALLFDAVSNEASLRLEVDEILSYEINIGEISVLILQIPHNLSLIYGLLKGLLHFQ